MRRLVGVVCFVMACGDPAAGADASAPDDAASDAGLDAAPDAPPDAPPIVPAQLYIKASNTHAGDRFGYSLAVSSTGDTLAVGAPLENSNAIGIGGDQLNTSATSAGAVYVFARAGTWSQQAYVKASNTEFGDSFGYVVGLSADGNTLAVSAAFEASAATGIGGDQTSNAAGFSGAVYVFTRAGTTWTQQAYIKASNTGQSDGFGRALRLSADGNTLAVGALDEDSNALGIGGDQASNAALNSGAVYVFTRAGTTWTQQAYVKASNTGAGDRFGSDVALSADGNAMAIGATGEDGASPGINGDQANNTASNSGAVYLFTRTGTTWTQQAYVKASQPGDSDNFGNHVSLSSTGDTLAVGAQNEDSAATGIDGNQADNSASGAGAVYMFTSAGFAWSQQAYVKASNTDALDVFGCSVELTADGNKLVVGAYGEASAATGIDGDQTDDTTMSAGAAYVFTRSGTLWTQQYYLKASNTFADDGFGSDVGLSLDGSLIAVSAATEDSAATGVGGNQNDRSANASGAVYLFQ